MYLFTTLIAISVGLLAVNAFKPGNIPTDEVRIEKRIAYELWLVENPGVKKLDSHNFLADTQYQETIARVQKQDNFSDIHNSTIEQKMVLAEKTKRQPPLQPIVDVIPDNIIGALLNMEMLQIIFFAIMLGIVIANFPQEKSTFLNSFFSYMNDAFVVMIGWVIKAMPIFVFALMGGSLVKSAGDNLSKLGEEMIFLASYGGVVLLALAFITFVIYPLLSHFFVKNLSFKDFYKGIAKAQLTAFSTSSSIATLPVTMNCVE
jgi:Na+/H+-dicarboxylate symporter